MDALNEDKYVAKYPMPEGGVIKTSGEIMSQQEWDERSEGLKDYPGSFEAIFDLITKRNKRLAEIKRRHEEIWKQEEDKAMMEIGRYLVKLLIEKAKETKAEEEDLGTSSDSGESDSDEDTQWSP